jgi:hypothetical protein
VKVEGFTSAVNAHAHLLKHMLRMTGLSREAFPDERDPEQWSELVRDPPLATSVRKRRSTAFAMLQDVPGCEAGRRSPTDASPCDDCRDPAAIRAASGHLGALVSEYAAVATRALEWGARTNDRRSVRLLAYRTADCTFVQTVDADHVKVVGILEETSGSVHIVTCFRKLGEPLRRQWLELARLRASYAAAGALVPTP